MKQTGEFHDMTITGYYLPAHPDDDQPVLLRLEGKLLLPIFSTPQKAQECMKRCGIEAKLKVIQDGRDFLQSVQGQGVMVAADPWITSDGNTRFALVRLPNDVN